ncbi:TonB-dependent siderophore receptor [Pseudomonas sp. FME51]|uniref:TonB-dependent siderophore receptor n=1 Tax=Pseudomonas sp. FME51 TaxID=2742609 RepID=UPI001868123F|nr:TonB-dependent receptor [Pseudomonas sp. FME51]
MSASHLNQLRPLAKALLMRNSIRSHRLPASIGLALTLAVATQVQAQEWTLDIPAQSLSQALQVLAAQTDVQILYNPADLQGLRSNPLSGRYGLDESISTLLQGTGVGYSLDGNTVALQPPVSGAEALKLSSVTISGKAVGSTTEGTGSYTTYSTSTSTRLNLSPLETPQSVSVLTRQRMDDQKLDNLPDALNAVTGITVKTPSPGADTPQIWARSSTIRNFQIDGVPTSASLSHYLQSTAMYDRIEVAKGATGLMNGLGYPSATINMIRKRPTASPQVSISAEAGSWDRYGMGLDVSGPLNDAGNLRGRLVTEYKNQHSWTDNYQQDRVTLYGISELDLGEDTLLTVGFSHLTRNTDAPSGNFPSFYSNGNKINASPSDGARPSWSYYDHEVSSIFASIEHQFTSGWSFKSELTHTQYEYDTFFSRGLGGSIDETTGLGGSASALRWASEIKQTSLDSYITGPFSLFGRTHELIGGLTLSNHDSTSPGYTLVSPIYQATDIFSWAKDMPKPVFNKTSKTETNGYQYGAYLSSRFHLTDSTSLLLGGRVTDWKENKDSTTYATGNKSKTKLRESGIFTPYVGIVHALNDNWSLYASYTDIFQPQDSFIHNFMGYTVDPEEGTSYEVGVKASFYDGRLNSSLAVFKTNQDNLASWDTVLVTYEILNDTTTEGIELDFNGELAEGWNFSAGYTYSRVENDDDERVLTHVPLHNMKVFTTYRMPGMLDKLTIGGGMNWESKTFNNANKEYKQSSYALFNLMARYDISRNLSASINIDNLFDKEYYAVPGASSTYGAPRNFMTSLKYTF